MGLMSVFESKTWRGVPWILRIINIIYMLPVLFAPWVFYCSFFIFDNPSDDFLAWMLFIGINLYSIILIGVVFISLKLYEKHKSLIKALIPNLCLVVCIILLSVL